MARPVQHRVGHELFHHDVFGGGVVAAGGALDHALVIESLVVARHDAVKHRLRMLSRGRGVVVDHVHAHAQTRPMQGLHHLAQLDDATRAVLGIAGITAFRRIEMERVVAPIETVLRGHGLHGGLLAVAVGAAGWAGGEAAGFGHAGQIEHGQQMHIGQACAGQGLEVLHATRLAVGEGQVLAAVGSRDGFVADRKVPHMQFIDHHVGGLADGGWGCVAHPACGLQGCIVQVQDLAAPRIGTQTDRVRVGDEVAHPAHAGHMQGDSKTVVGTRGVGGQLG